MPDKSDYVFQFDWDDSAEVWTARSKDVPGLVLEGADFDLLLARVRFAVPELLEVNSHENIVKIS